MFSRIVIALLVTLLGASLSPLPATAQSAQLEEPGATLEVIENRMQQVEASSALDEPSEKVLLDYYRRAIGLIEQRRNHETASAGFVGARESAPKRAAAARAQIEKLELRPPPKLPDSLSRKNLAQLEQQLLSEKSDLTGLSSDLDELESALENQTQRPPQLRARLNQIKQRQPEIASALESPVPDNQPQRLTEARRWALQHEARTLAAEVEMLEQELLSQPMRVELLGARRDLAALQQSRQLQYVELLEALVAQRRLAEAESAREEAAESERLAFGKHPLLQEMAQQNTRLGEDLNQLATDLAQVNNEKNTATAEAKRISESFRLARLKLEIAGLSEALGQVLLEQRRGLPDERDFRAAAKRRQQLVVEASLRQIRNQQERARLRDLEVYVENRLTPLPQTWQLLLREEARELAAARRELIDKAIAADDAYLRALGELDFAQRQLSEAVAAYNQFLDERLLWVRTGEHPSWSMLASISATLGNFLSLAHWLELAGAILWPDTVPWKLLLGAALFALLIWGRGRMRASLRRSGKNVGQLRHDRYIATLRALLLTLLLALPWPLLFASLGLQLQSVQDFDAADASTQLYLASSRGGEFVPAIGTAFSDIALYLFYFVAFLIFCEADGLAIRHFRWCPPTVAMLRVETLRLMSILLPAGFFLIAAISYDPAALAGGLSRLLFAVVMLSLAWFFVRSLAPRNGLLSEYCNQNPGSPLTWLRYLWFGLAPLLPVLLALLAAIGYVYTAAQFGARLFDTLWLIVAIILIHELVVRWLLLVERRLKLRDALLRHRAQRAARAAQPADDSAAPESGPLQFEEPEVDYDALGEETKKLISTVMTVVTALGLWVIWSDVSPAFRILDDVSLWSYTETVDGADKLVPVTLGDVVLGLLIVIVGVVAALRLPALMEFVLLTRLRISAGSRYAISTLTQYAIVAAGIVLVFNILGGSWSNIQWLVAALGVGIGFGLQEIVANFISGLILLFERPIRIGDVVTVGDTSGVVTRIRIRSTTIRNWDQQELVVPNKEFITGRLLNWTLSDPMARIVIPVGIAYGSDIGQALKLVTETAAEHENVLEDPEPLVTFESFGDNALVIMMRCYIESMDQRLKIQSELNQEINRKFAAAGIEIAFPQRDVHLDTSQPLELRLHRVKSESD